MLPHSSGMRVCSGGGPRWGGTRRKAGPSRCASPVRPQAAVGEETPEVRDILDEEGEGGGTSGGGGGGRAPQAPLSILGGGPMHQRGWLWVRPRRSRRPSQATLHVHGRGTVYTRSVPSPHTMGCCCGCVIVQLPLAPQVRRACSPMMLCLSLSLLLRRRRLTLPPGPCTVLPQSWGQTLMTVACVPRSPSVSSAATPVLLPQSLTAGQRVETGPAAVRSSASASYNPLATSELEF